MRRHDPEAHYRYDRQYYDRTYRRSPTYAPHLKVAVHFVPWCRSVTEHHG